MTLEEAIAVLNENSHRGFSGWSAEESAEPEEPDQEYARGRFYYDSMTPFEAIAVAEKYLATKG